MKSATLDKLQCAARANAVRLVYFDEAGFAASPPVQRAWSPRGLPHRVEPRLHCRRLVLGALDFGTNALTHHVTISSIKDGTVIEFLEQIAQQGDERPSVVVLDNFDPSCH
ncbi:transposase [Caballeronia sordidicola]|uniref:transposase n=1 Tax=Caballeronia sordidicola TaxID=196367 RepID=UPI00094E76B7|nr:transposase [Caballeronia sordidicola]